MAFTAQTNAQLYTAGSSTSSLDFSKSLNGKLMETKERFSAVYLEQPKYNVLSQLVDLLAPAKQLNQRVYSRSRMGSIGYTYTCVTDDIQSLAAATTTESNDSIDILADSAAGSLLELRKGDVVQVDNAGTTAQFIVVHEKGEATANTVRLQAADISADGPKGASIHSTYIAAGATITVLFDSHANDFSTDDKKPLFYMPTALENFTGVSRDSVHISRDALHRGTYELWDGEFWSFAQEKLMKMRFSKQYEQKLLLAEKTGHVSGNLGTDGAYSRTIGGGILWFIKNHGQTFNKTTDFDLDDINDIVYNILTIGAAGTSSIAVLCGAYFLKRFQEEAANKYIQYVGTSNTLGGAAVRGISIYEYNVLGVSVKFVHYPAFDDPKLFPGVSTTLGGVLKSSANALFLDMTDVESSEGMIPAFEKYYYGDKDMYYTYVPGMIGLNGADPTNSIQGSYNLSANASDGFSAHIMCDDGIYVNAPERHCFYQYTGA